MRISFSPLDVGKKEAEQVKEALIFGWIITGPKTKELERQVASSVVSIGQYVLDYRPLVQK